MTSENPLERIEIETIDDTSQLELREPRIVIYCKSLLEAKEIKQQIQQALEKDKELCFWEFMGVPFEEIISWKGIFFIKTNAGNADTVLAEYTQYIQNQKIVDEIRRRIASLKELGVTGFNGIDELQQLLKEKK